MIQSVLPIPCLMDNYAWILLSAEGDCAIVDPSEGEPVLRVLAEQGVVPRVILATHHHYDHIGGIEEIVARFPSIEVWGSEYDGAQGRIPGQTRRLAHGEPISVLGESGVALHVPAHTLGALAYSLPGRVFTGDTLFCAGCGRLFEGTATQMDAALNEILAILPDETRVYCGHEYTVSNLAFAVSVEPYRTDLGSAFAKARALRELGQPTVPSTLAWERLHNPFLRCHTASVRASLGCSADADRAEVLATLRRAKDQFTGR